MSDLDIAAENKKLNEVCAADSFAYDRRIAIQFNSSSSLWDQPDDIFGNPFTPIPGVNLNCYKEKDRPYDISINFDRDGFLEKCKAKAPIEEQLPRVWRLLNS